MNLQVLERLTMRIQAERDQWGFTTTQYDELDAELDELRFLLRFSDCLEEYCAEAQKAYSEQSSGSSKWLSAWAKKDAANDILLAFKHEILAVISKNAGVDVLDADSIPADEKEANNE